MICRRAPPYANLILSAACVLIFSTFAASAPAADVTATRLDGTTIAGELRHWNAAEIVIAAPTGEQRFAANQLISLRWNHAANTAATVDNNTPFAELIDGSILPLKSIRVEQSSATLALANPKSGGDATLTVPTSQLAAIRLRQLEGPLAAQWDEMRRQNIANDILAVLKKDGKSLDYVEGVVGQISDDKIEFKLEGQSQRVDRAKIAGIVYYRPDRRTKSEPRANVQGRSGLRASATRIELKDSQLELTTAVGIKLSWPLDDIELADFSAGKLIYLSDIEPGSDSWTPLVGLPAAAKLAAEYGRPRRDKSAYGGTLTLLVKENESSQPSPQSFAKGLALRSRTEVVYRLPDGYHKFIALAGIDPATSTTGNVHLVISGDNRVLVETDIAGDQQARPLQLDITEVKRLKILVDFGQNLDTGDWLNLCDARIVK
jgi:hypothetical protein